MFFDHTSIDSSCHDNNDDDNDDDANNANDNRDDDDDDDDDNRKATPLLWCQKSGVQLRPDLMRKVNPSITIKFRGWVSNEIFCQSI